MRIWESVHHGVERSRVSGLHRLAGIFTVALASFVSSSALADTPGTALSSGRVRLTFSQLASCPPAAAHAPDKASMLAQLPEAIRAAEGQPVQIAGYMLPLKTDGAKTQEFLLMRDQMACCFGQSPQATEFLVVRAKQAQPVMLDIPVLVTGILRLEPVVAENVVLQFFSLDDAQTASFAPL